MQGFERADRQFLDAAPLDEIHALMFVEGADDVFLISFLGFWKRTVNR